MVKKKQKFYSVKHYRKGNYDKYICHVYNMEELTFEEAIENLEKIVAELEEGNLSLDDSVKKFECGMKLSKYCNEIISKAEKEITILLEKENGEIEEENFIAEDKTEEDK